LAAEVPSIDKGSVSKDGKSVTWRLKSGVQWHDGQPLTADDIVFTWQYTTDPATGSTRVSYYSNIESIDKIDDLTVRVNFKEPTPFWQIAFVGDPGHVLPRHVLEPFKGAEARNAPFNLKPVGTGPYKIVDFRPGDVTLAEINQSYHVANRPFFDRVELKGGGDATSAARAVLQTGDYDYAWNTLVADDLLASMEKGGTGKVMVTAPSGCESIYMQNADPNQEINGERASVNSKHPFFSDLKVRQAFALAINRKLIGEQVFGRQGTAATYPVVLPKQYLPDGTYEYNLQKAAQMLDDAGWKKGPDGVRTKDGKSMKVLYQTSVNDLRQNTQAIIKKDLESIGIPVELKSVNDSVFFGGDPNNPDNINHFFADLQMYNSTYGADPQTYLRSWVASLTGGGADNIAQKTNGWSGQNYSRYQNPDYDKIWLQARGELDPIKRADLIKQAQKLLVNDGALIPLVNRPSVLAAKNDLRGMDPGPFDSQLWKLPYWHRA
jgi:peptide/nickel transport system substrate-binding protein